MEQINEFTTKQYCKAAVVLHSRAAAPQAKRKGLLAEDGMSTAEYAIGTLAAAAIAGVLLAVAKSEMFRDMITKLMKQAFNV